MNTHGIPQHGGLYEFKDGKMVPLEGGPPAEVAAAPEPAPVAVAAVVAPVKTPGVKK